MVQPFTRKSVIVSGHVDRISIEGTSIHKQAERNEVETYLYLSRWCSNLIQDVFPPFLGWERLGKKLFLYLSNLNEKNQFSYMDMKVLSGRKMRRDFTIVRRYKFYITGMTIIEDGAIL